MFVQEIPEIMDNTMDFGLQKLNLNELNRLALCMNLQWPCKLKKA